MVGAVLVSHPTKVDRIAFFAKEEGIRNTLHKRVRGRAVGPPSVDTS